MFKARKNHFSVRPQQPIHWLALLGFVCIGVLAAGEVYVRSGVVLLIAFFALALVFATDRITFDGKVLKRVGFIAWLQDQIGISQTLELDEIEFLFSRNKQTIFGVIFFQTTITASEIKWKISSDQRVYQPFVKALFKNVPTVLLDSLSSELLYYWEEKDPSYKLVNDKIVNAQRIERWRRKAVRLSLDGQFEAAAKYLKIAHENAPHDPQIAYDTGRFLRRRALSYGLRTDRREADMLRAETYFRMAGRLAREQKKARLLERIGEEFYEHRQFETAQKYFDLATRIDPVRPRANLGLAGVALQSGQSARAIYAFNQVACGAEAAGAEGLSKLALRKSEYYERLTQDVEFLSDESGWEGVLKQLKIARWSVLIIFLITWMLQLNLLHFDDSMLTFMRDITATLFILWICNFTASQIILAYRRE